ncbi:MAG: nucleotidyltransferase domain-containing protein [Anaerolineae bacterium]|nr:nucleotidyltransferase domain-containing protein [Anaerolineae bacterium]
MKETKPIGSTGEIDPAASGDAMNDFLRLAEGIASCYSQAQQVEAVALGGSAASGLVEAGSDIDLYVYLNAPLPLQVRSSIARAAASYAEVDNQFWEPGDEWIDRVSGIHVDVMFRDIGWIQDQLDRVLLHFQASVGYTTCLWHNVMTSKPLYDRGGWFRRFQEQAARPYPEQLRGAIIEKNHPILRTTASSYLYQLTRAVAREDWISVNHRVAALLASYFDILFAINRTPHPGEKRLLQIALSTCARTPEGIVEHIEALLRATHRAEVLTSAECLIDGLENLLRAEALIA